jgi:hypothetical protein
MTDDLLDLYLDTSAIRGQGGAFDAAGPRAFTASALTFVELLNGIGTDDTSYTRRRSAIRRVIENSAIRVIWEFPDQRITNCFGELQRAYQFIEKRVPSLQDILRLVQQHEGRGDFLTAEQGANVEYHLDYFEHLDNAFGQPFRLATVDGNIQVRSMFDAARSLDSPVVPSFIRQGSFRDFCLWFRDQQRDLNRAITIAALARRAAVQVDSSQPDLLVRRFYDTYDGSIDLFVDALSHATMSMMSDMTGPGRNDPIDLAHFLYLSQRAGLVTNDKKLTEIAISVGVTVFSTVELWGGASE